MSPCTQLSDLSPPFYQLKCERLELAPEADGEILEYASSTLMNVESNKPVRYPFG